MIKILTSGVIALSLGLSWLANGDDAGSVAAIDADCQPACLEDCDATIERLSEDVCRIECTDENGDSCWVVVSCDPSGGCEILDRGGDCDKPICGPAGCESSNDGARPCAADVASPGETSGEKARPACDASACEAAGDTSR